MKIEKLIRIVLIWMPSVMISMVFIQNGMKKIFQPNQLDKIITNNTAIIVVGIILLIATALFLLNKTIIWGTTILASYMTFISFIHMYKGKPFEVVVLIAMATILPLILENQNCFTGSLNHKVQIKDDLKKGSRVFTD